MAGTDAAMRARPIKPMAAPDAGVQVKPIMATMGVMQPDAMRPPPMVSGAPPRHPGPAPVLVIQFRAESGRSSKDHYRAVRQLVEQHGYRDLEYHLTGYAAEMHRDRYNLDLAKKRCRRVARLIRKRGVSRRWIKCLAPVYRNQTSKPEAAHLTPAWRRVEIRVKK
jgi:hypothetical protein